MNKIKLSAPTWVELYGEISSYVNSKVRSIDNSRTEDEYQEDYINIVDDVEEILENFFIKEQNQTKTLQRLQHLLEFFLFAIRGGRLSWAKKNRIIVRFRS